MTSLLRAYKPSWEKYLKCPKPALVRRAYSLAGGFQLGNFKPTGAGKSSFELIGQIGIGPYNYLIRFELYE